MARLSSHTRLLLLALLLAAWAWQLTGLDFQSLWRDETDSLRFATRPLAEVLANFTRPGENGPLYFLLLRPWLALTGHSEFALRLPSALSGVLALPLLFAWGRRLFDVRLGLLAALLLAANPYHLWYSQEAKMYALLVVVIMLALWVFAQAVERGKWWRWALWLGTTSICFYIHVLGILVVPVQIVWLLITPRWRKRWKEFAAALAVMILPYVPLVWWQWTLLTDPNFRTGHPFVPLDRILLALFAAQIQGIPVRPTVWVLAPPMFLLLAALLLSRRQIPARRLALLWWLLPPLGVFAISLLSPIFTDRYLIWTLPALALLLAFGVTQVEQQNRWLGAVLLVVLVGFQLWTGWRQMNQPIKSDFRAAAAYVTEHRQPGDATLFLIPYIRHTYQYYDPDLSVWLDAPYANRAPDATLLPDRLNSLTQGYDGVWLVESEAEFYDRDGLTRLWLDEHGQLSDEAHFRRVDLYYFEMN